MARDKGQKTFASNYEVKIAEMLDPRLLVDSKEELIKKDTWPSDGNTIYMKEGMFVYVKGDGFYELVSLANILATDYSGWKKVTSGAEGGSGVYFSDMLTPSEIVKISTGEAVTVDESKVADFISNAKDKVVVFYEYHENGYESYVMHEVECYESGEIYLTYCGFDDDDSPVIASIYYVPDTHTFYRDIYFRAHDYQPLLESGTNIKTINGKKVLGSGDLKTTYEISMVMIGGVTGGSGSVSSQLYIYPNKIVKPTSAITTDVIIAYNTSPSLSPTNMEEYLIEFAYTSGSISFPSTVKWQNETVPTFKSGYTYQISIVNNLACFAEFKNA